jgi:hypothetical protein
VHASQIHPSYEKYVQHKALTLQAANRESMIKDFGITVLRDVQVEPQRGYNGKESL